MTFARRWAMRGILAVVGAAALAIGMASAYGLYLSASLALPSGDEHLPRLVYGAPFLLKPDLDLADRLGGKFSHLRSQRLRNGSGIGIHGSSRRRFGRIL